MKNKIVVLTNMFAVLLLIGFIPMFILWACFVGNPYDYYTSIIFLCMWVPFLVVGLILFLLTLKQVKKIIDFYKDSIKIKAKCGQVLINTDSQFLKFKKVKISLQDIVEFQLVNNQTIVEKSGMGESIVGGMLFGGTGAIAGAMVGKKQKLKDNYRVFIKTKNVKHAGIVISLKVENAYNLFETLKLVTANQ